MKLVVPGRNVPNPTAPTFPPDLLKISGAIREVDLATTRAAGAKPEEIDARDEDIVEVHYDNGVVQWTTAAQFRDDRKKAAADRGEKIADDDVVHVPTTIPHRDAKRGLFGWVLKKLRVLPIDFVGEKIAGLGKDKIVEKFEEKQSPPSGLYRVQANGGMTPAGEIAGADKPYLVFIHGTASSTEGSFGELFKTPEWEALREEKAYGDRILALQHKTLSVSPIRNALDLAEQMPRGATMHLVTHSRGGLVGELLCMASVEKSTLRVYEKRDDRADELALLNELGRVLQDRKFTIGKFARVACPARGTILASKRLDLYLSVILNLIKVVLPESLLYEVFQSTAMALIKMRTKPEELPGLEAMMPESPLVHFLNQRLVRSAADLGVISGDLEGSGFWDSLKALATDAFYLEDHDLVVNTGSMYGGMGRKEGAYYFFDKGAGVNHFSYFKNSRTRERLKGWLRSEERDPAFQPFNPETDEELPASRAADAPNPIALVVIPDVFGTTLVDGDAEVWPSVPYLAQHGVARLDDPALKPGKLVSRMYGRLQAYFGDRYTVKPFPYDWRQSLKSHADALRALIAAGPARVVAHGAGGLVFAAYLDKYADEWAAAAADNGARALMLGVPFGGIPEVQRWCSGRSPLTAMLNRIDGGVLLKDEESIGAMLRSWPGIAELQSGRTLPPNRLEITLVAGRAPATLAAVEANGALIWSADGDGRVVDGRDALAPKYVAEIWHGDLADDPSCFPALEDLIAGGTTPLLQPPGAPSKDSVEAPSERPILFPTSHDLSDTASGAAPRGLPTAAVPVQPVDVVVKHGDLGRTRFPVAVGHYSGDNLVSAERALDCYLGGTLDRRFQSGDYPDAPGSFRVVRMGGNHQPPGALVIGLGAIGTVTQEVVSSGVQRAATEYALTLLDEEPRRSVPLEAGISTVLIGTKGGNALSIESSITAVLRGVIDANRALRRLSLNSRVHIRHVEIIELYEQIAIQSVRSARRAKERLKSELEQGERINVEQFLQAGENRRYDLPDDEYATGWWRRIDINRSGDALSFIVTSDRARAQGLVQDPERKKTDRLVEQAVTQSGYDPALAVTLFELLVPNEIKDGAVQGGDVVLVLDKDAARYPWEALADRTVGEIPLATRIGILRQFKVDNAPPAARSSDKLRALVVGDVENTKYSKLSGAIEEAKKVTKVLQEAGFEVAGGGLFRPDADHLIKCLFRRDYRILHLAGHGLYTDGDVNRSGMILGNDDFITATTVAKLRVLPDLVFLNCCHLGNLGERERARRQPHRLAPTIAEELIRKGVKCVIAAGWAVDDAAALTFAAAFYRSMLIERRPFGEAVKIARLETYRYHRYTNTWAAYQAYGNPGFRLAPSTEDRIFDVPRGFCSAREYIEWYRSLAAAVRADNLNVDRQSLQIILTNARDQQPKDLDDGRLLTEVAEAWKALGDVSHALAYYEKAIELKESTAPIKALEALTNQSIRRAAKLDENEKDEIEKLVTLSRKYAAMLRMLPQTEERDAILGSLYKRLAAMSSAAKDRLDAVQASMEHYRRVNSYRKPEKRDPYQDLNAVTMQWLFEALSGSNVVQADGGGDAVQQVSAGTEVLITIRNEVTARATATSDYWSRVGLPDLTVTESLIAGDLGQKIDAIVKDYKDVMRGAQPHEVDSSVDHLRIVAKILKGGHAQPALADALNTIVNRLLAA